MLAFSDVLTGVHGCTKLILILFTCTEGCCVMWRFLTRCAVLRPAEPRSHRLCSRISLASLFFTSTTRLLRFAACTNKRWVCNALKHVDAALAGGSLLLTCPFEQVGCLF